jgi:MFS family permease
VGSHASVASDAVSERGAPRRSLLRRNRQFRILVSARVVSFAGDQLTTVALTLLVHQRYGLGSAVSLLLVAQVVPQLAGPLAGAIVDRTDQRRVLRVCEVARAGVVTSIALTLPPLPVLAALVAANAVLATTLRPAGRSAIPALVEPDELGTANATLATGANLGLALGPAAGGALTAWVGVPGALLVDVATSLASAIGLRALRRLPPATPRDVPARSLAADIRAGLAYAWRDRLTRPLTLVLFLGVALAGTVMVAGVFLVRDVLDGGPTSYGLFTGVWGLGMIAASLVIASSHRPARPGTWLIVALAAQATGLLAAGGAPVLALAILAAGIGGAGNGLQDIATDTILQQRVPRPLLGRVVGAVYAASFAGELVAYAQAGPLIDLIGARPLLLAAGIGLVALTTYVAAAWHRHQPDDPAP